MARRQDEVKREAISKEHIFQAKIKIMFRVLLIILLTGYHLLSAQTDDGWTITARDINPNNYYGVTVANGMIGIVSSPEPLKVADVVLNGVYDYYQRGRVSNILKTFNHVNMELDVDGQRISRKNIDDYTQTLNTLDDFCWE